MTTCVMYLMCRGRTANDDAVNPVLLGRRLEPRLSSVGRQNVTDVAAVLQRRKPTTIYTSAAVRAVETANIVWNKCTNATFRLHSALQPIDYGSWEGLTLPQIIATDGTAFSAQLRDPRAPLGSAGESLYAAQQRLLPFLQHCARVHIGQTIIVVTHCVVAKVAIAAATRLPLQYVRDLDQTPGGVSVLRTTNGSFALGAINQSVLEVDNEPEDEDQRACAPVGCAE